MRSPWEEDEYNKQVRYQNQKNERDERDGWLKHHLLEAQTEKATKELDSFKVQEEKQNL
jgi:hypothetical protein